MPGVDLILSLATETERTLFFDFLPLELGNIRGFKTRFHLYTVPGQVFYDASRKLILKRDLPNTVPVEALQAALNARNVPWFEAVATQGIGVFETLKGAAKLVLGELKKTTLA